MSDGDQAQEGEIEHRTLAAALVESLPDAAWLVDGAALRVAAVNRAAERLLGRDRATLIGRNVRSLASTPEDLAFWEQVATGGDAQIHSDTFVTRDDGRTVPVTRHVAPLADGTLRWLLVTLHDRSEQRRIEAVQILQCVHHAEGGPDVQMKSAMPQRSKIHQ